MNRTKNQYSYRFLARVVIEAETPIAVGAGIQSSITDAPVAKDVNGLPYIPGTAICGVFRHVGKETYRQDTAFDQKFGFHEGRQSKGSLIYFSDALMIGEQGLPVDGLNPQPDTAFYKAYKNLPIRNRVCITDKGVGKKGAKFDHEVVYSGTRFCFEIEMHGKKEEEETFFSQLLRLMWSKNFRLGGNTRNGSGAVKIISCQTAKLNLKTEDDLSKYLEKSASLSGQFVSPCSEFSPGNSNQTQNEATWIEYELNIRPEDFFFFGSGHGDAQANADMTPVREDKVVWNSGTPQIPHLKKMNILIPASSVKGAIAHRVAYNYNLLKKRYAVRGTDARTGEENEAVMALFGYHNHEKMEMKRGNVIISDVFLPDSNHQEKYFNHISIDYFTGGGINGALFTDKVDLYTVEFKLTVSVHAKALEDETVKKSFEMTLNDICNGLLPLGGSVNRGYGCFNGSLTIKTNNK